MMATVIHSKPDGGKASSGHNLAILFTYARKAGGVKQITVNKLNDESENRPRAFVQIYFANGAIGETYFCDDSHAEDWARHYSGMSPRVSWWAGCRVEVVSVPSGAWCYLTDTQKGKA